MDILQYFVGKEPKGIFTQKLDTENTLTWFDLETSINEIKSIQNDIDSDVKDYLIEKGFDPDTHKICIHSDYDWFKSDYLVHSKYINRKQLYIIKNSFSGKNPVHHVYDMKTSKLF